MSQHKSFLIGALGAVLAALLITGCGQSQAPQAPPATAPATTPAPDAGARQPQPQPVSATPRATPFVTLTGEDDGRAVRLQRGQVVEIRLPADRASSFTWIPVRNMLPTMSTDGLPVFEPETGAEGAPGIEVWRFIAREPGHADLVFEYRRLTDPGAPPSGEVAYHFDVE